MGCCCKNISMLRFGSMGQWDLPASMTIDQEFLLKVSHGKCSFTPGHLAREMRIFEPAKTRCVLRLSTKEHFNMADDFDSMIRAIRTTFKDENFQNRFAFEDEVNNSLQMLVEKHRVDTGSIQEALCSKIPAREILLEEIQHWISVIKKRLSPRMKAHNAWTIEFKRDIPSQVFRLILKAVQKARSAFGVSCTETRKNISIQYTEKKRLTRDLTGLGQITRETLSEFFNRNFQGKRRGSANVICNKEKPFSIQYERRSSKVIVKCHYTFTNEFGFTFES